MASTTINSTQARSNLYKLIEDVGVSHSHVVITGKKNNAVLVSENDWESIQETLYLLSMPGMGISILQGLREPTKECSKDLDW